VTTNFVNGCGASVKIMRVAHGFECLWTPREHGYRPFKDSFEIYITSTSTITWICNEHDLSLLSV
jgi:hypothetical protein